MSKEPEEVVPSISVNGHTPSSAMRITGQVLGKSKKKGEFLEIVHNRRSWFDRDGRWHRIFRSIHRPNRLGLKIDPTYTEVILDEESGEVVHDGSEPLADHRGHGSDKPNLRSEGSPD